MEVSDQIKLAIMIVIGVLMLVAIILIPGDDNVITLGEPFKTGCDSVAQAREHRLITNPFVYPEDYYYLSANPPRSSSVPDHRPLVA